MSKHAWFIVSVVAAIDGCGIVVPYAMHTAQGSVTSLIAGILEWYVLIGICTIVSWIDG